LPPFADLREREHTAEEQRVRGRRRRQREQSVHEGHFTGGGTKSVQSVEEQGGSEQYRYVTRARETKKRKLCEKRDEKTTKIY